MKTVSLTEIELRFREWLEGLLKTHTDYKPDMPFDLKFVARCIWGKIEDDYARLKELEDKLESGQLVDTAPYIVEIKNEIPFKYKVIKPTVHKRNVEMCSSQESAEARLKKLQAVKK